MSIRFSSANYNESTHQIALHLEDSSHPNNPESCFGFHTHKTVPIRNRTVTYNGRSQYSSSRGAATDDEKQAAIEAAKTKCIEKHESIANALALNALNILGYIPVLGLIPCSARLIHPLCSEHSAMHHEPVEVRKAQYIRGALEGTGLGILLLIPDLIITVKRL